MHVDCGTLALGQSIHNASIGRVPVLCFAGLSPFTQRGELLGSRTEYDKIYLLFYPSDIGTDLFTGCKMFLTRPRLSGNIVDTPVKSNLDGTSRKWSTEPCRFLCQIPKVQLTSWPLGKFSKRYEPSQQFKLTDTERPPTIESGQKISRRRESQSHCSKCLTRVR